MNLVYFNESLAERAPHMMGALAVADGSGWVALPQVVHALRAGEPVIIRQASESEARRAEDAVAAYELAMQLASRVYSLLDSTEGEKAAVAGATELRAAFEDAQMLNKVKCPTDLLDKNQSLEGA